MPNSTSTLPLILTMIQQKLAYYVLPSYLIFGLLGNTFCIYHFSRPKYRTSTCALYVLLAAITNTLAVTFGVTTTIVDTSKSLLSTSLIYCKLRMYINHSLIFIGRMFTLMASIDTYTMTSSRRIYRQFSKRTTVYKCALGIVICCPLIAVHIAIMNRIVSGQCVMTGIYSLIFTIYQMFIAGIFPPITMTIFSYLAYSNMKNNVVQQHDPAHQRKRQHQRQLVSMITTQVIVYIISAELNPLTTLYRQITSNIPDKSRDRKAIESFIIFISGNFLLYLNTWAAFLIYYITSSNFRTAFIRLFKKNYRIQPQETTVGVNLVELVKQIQIHDRLHTQTLE